MISWLLLLQKSCSKIIYERGWKVSFIFRLLDSLLAEGESERRITIITTKSLVGMTEGLSCIPNDHSFNPTGTIPRCSDLSSRILSLFADWTKVREGEERVDSLIMPRDLIIIKPGSESLWLWVICPSNWASWVNWSIIWTSLHNTVSVSPGAKRFHGSAAVFEFDDSGSNWLATKQRW